MKVPSRVPQKNPWKLWIPKGSGYITIIAIQWDWDYHGFMGISPSEARKHTVSSFESTKPLVRKVTSSQWTKSCQPRSMACRRSIHTYTNMQYSCKWYHEYIYMLYYIHISIYIYIYHIWICVCIDICTVYTYHTWLYNIYIMAMYIYIMAMYIYILQLFPKYVCIYRERDWLYIYIYMISIYVYTIKLYILYV